MLLSLRKYKAKEKPVEVNTSRTPDLSITSADYSYRRIVLAQRYRITINSVRAEKNFYSAKIID